MVAIRFRLVAGFLAMLAALAVCVPLCAKSYAPPPAGNPQYSGELPSPNGAPAPSNQPQGDVVKDVRVEGNYHIEVSKLPQLRTRKGETFDPLTVKEDVRKLAESKKFLDVKSQFQAVPGGIVVIFQVVERPVIHDPVKFVGNRNIRTQTLRKKSELEKGQPLDPYAVEEARRRVEQYYHESGYNHVVITTIEGSKPNDHNVVFMVDEGEQQKVRWVTFEGNTFEGDARLRLQCTVKPFMGYIPIFGSKYDSKKIDDDRDKLTAYYRSFGYFQARISPEKIFSEDKDWVTIKYIINEGPRYNVRNVSFIGNEKFKIEDLNKNLEQIKGKPFSQLALNRDLTSIKDVYGEHGYIFADVAPENRLSAEKPEVDIVYNIAEGKRYRVGQVNINITGDNGHTNQSVILNRMSVRPGDIVNTKKLREDERRIKFASVFNTDPSKGDVPKITFSKPDDMKEEGVAKRPRSVGSSSSGDQGGPYRSQSPGQPGMGSGEWGMGNGPSQEQFRSQSPDDLEDIDLVLVRDAEGNTSWIASPAAPHPVQHFETARFQSPGDSNWSGYNNSSQSANQAYSTWGISQQNGSGGYLPRSAQPAPASNVTSPYQTYPSSSYPAAASPYSNASYPTQQVPARTVQQTAPSSDPFANQAPPAYSSAPPPYGNAPAYNNPPANSYRPAYANPPVASAPAIAQQPGYGYTAAPAQPGYAAAPRPRSAIRRMS